MKMYDCDVCLSAGSVNKWGFCEICGEEFEDPDSRVMHHDGLPQTTSLTTAAQLADMMPTVTSPKLAAISK